MAIKSLRKRNRMTQAALASVLGVRQNTVAQWETGARTPSARRLLQIAKLYGVTVDELLKEESDSPRE